MRYAFAAILLLIWLLLAPWIAKGYGEWHLPILGRDSIFDLALFYFLPVAALAIAITTYREKRAK